MNTVIPQVSATSCRAVISMQLRSCVTSTNSKQRDISGESPAKPAASPSANLLKSEQMFKQMLKHMLTTD